MPKILRLLIVEDSEDDTQLVLHALQHGGYSVIWERVDTAPALAAALERQAWDAIISDHAMPHFSAPAALALVREKQPGLPFIIISGEMGLELVVTALKAGAHDFIPKRELARLVPAIEREVGEAEARRECQRMEATLRDSQEQYRQLIENMNDLVCEGDSEGRFLYASPRYQPILGYAPEELLGRLAADLVHPEDRPRFDQHACAREARRDEWRFRHKNGGWR